MIKEKSYHDIYGGFGKTLNLGLTVGVSIALCTFLGYKSDEYFNTAPQGIIGGAMFGLIAGVVNMWEQLKGIDKRLKRRQEDAKAQSKDKQS